MSMNIERDTKIGFGVERKLSRIDDRKSVHIKNMGRLTIIDPRGFGQTENPIFESCSVYTDEPSLLLFLFLLFDL